MTKEFSRSRRVGEQIQRELAQLIQQEVKDPRVGMVTVSAVEVSRDLASAKVYVTSLTGSDPQQTLAALKRTGGFLRRELGKRLMLRIVPELHFTYDVSIERGAHLSALIDEAVSKDRNEDNS